MRCIGHQECRWARQSSWFRTRPTSFIKTHACNTVAYLEPHCSHGHITVSSRECVLSDCVQGYRHSSRPMQACVAPISSHRRLCTLDVLAVSDRCISCAAGEESLLHVTNCNKGPIWRALGRFLELAACGFLSFRICAQSRYFVPKADSHSVALARCSFGIAIDGGV
jgi:hypothetical protein